MKPGVVELLEYLKQHAVRMAVASSAPMELIKSNLRLAGIADYFDAVVSWGAGRAWKAVPGSLLPSGCTETESAGTGLL